MNDKFEIEILKLLHGFIKPTHIQFVDQWMDSLHKWERINYENSSLWIERLIKSLESSNPMLDTYFILLAGLILDIEPSLDKKLSIIKRATPQTEKDLAKKTTELIKNNTELKTFLLSTLSLRNKVRFILNEITDEEKSSIIFLRNKYSHPILSAYKIKLVKSDEESKFEFDLKKYLSSGKHQSINQTELHDTTKAKLLVRLKELKELQNSLWDMRNNIFKVS